MKKILRPLTILIIGISLVVISTAFRGSTMLSNTRFSEYTGAALRYQTTATPEAQADRSEIGSTDDITVASFVIVAIIIIPIIIKRKSWTQA